MHTAASDFIERMGLLMEGEGMPRIAGRIFGFMLLEPGSCALDELAESLQVSKASISTNARLLEQCGLLDRSSEPGDRRDFYRMRADAWERMLQVATRKWGMRLCALEEGEAALPPQMDAARERLAEAVRFHRLLIDETSGLIERWKLVRAEGQGGGRG